MHRTQTSSSRKPALNKALSEGNKALYVLVHAHSAQTVQTSYIINPTSQFEKGVAYLHAASASATCVPVDSEQDQEEYAEMQENQRKLMLEFQEARSSVTMSNRQRTARQSITSNLKNEILFAIIELKVPYFTQLSYWMSCQ